MTKFLKVQSIYQVQRATLKTPIKMKFSTIAVIFSMFWSAVYAGRRVHRARRNAKNLPAGSNIQGRKGLAEMLAALLPNTYYSRPKFRYPFYHKDGKEMVLFSIFYASLILNQHLLILILSATPTQLWLYL